MSDALWILLWVAGGIALVGLLYWWIEIASPRMDMKHAIREAADLMKKHDRRRFPPK